MWCCLPIPFHTKHTHNKHNIHAAHAAQQKPQLPFTTTITPPTQERMAAKSHAAKQQLTISRLRQQLSKAQVRLYWCCCRSSVLCVFNAIKHVFSSTAQEHVMNTPHTHTNTHPPTHPHTLTHRHHRRS